MNSSCINSMSIFDKNYKQVIAVHFSCGRPEFIKVYTPEYHVVLDTVDQQARHDILYSCIGYHDDYYIRYIIYKGDVCVAELENNTLVSEVNIQTHYSYHWIIDKEHILSSSSSYLLYPIYSDLLQTMCIHSHDMNMRYVPKRISFDSERTSCPL